MKPLGGIKKSRLVVMTGRPVCCCSATLKWIGFIINLFGLCSRFYGLFLSAVLLAYLLGEAAPHAAERVPH